MARKRKTGTREPNGRLSRKPEDRKVRDKAEVKAADWDTMGTALLARHRVHKVDPMNLKDQKAGTAIGRYCLQGLVTEAQYDAAMTYLEERERYLQCIQAPRQPGAVDLNATRGQSVASENVSRTQQLRSSMRATEAAIMAKQIEVGNTGNLFGALHAVLIMDVQLDHLLGDLRTALNALIRRYRISAERTSTSLDVHREPA
jgi:hypothetical protein